jgi:hypothetical protein
MLSVKKEFIKAVLIFNKVAIEQDSVVPRSFPALVTKFQPINCKRGTLNRDLKDSFESDVKIITEGGK